MVVVVVGGGEKLAFNERVKSTWTMKYGSPHLYVH